ncbi:chemotaxis protein CheW [Candidatus Desantisbacteria bacterium]|nr:chemotaxis protein CheW [Candidatus Desantisbacteria bacterium]
MENNTEETNKISKKEKLLEEIQKQRKDEKESTGEEKISLVISYLNKEWYGINIENVAEIIKLVNIVPLPQISDYILGIINLRGEILPVIDLRKLFEISISPFSKETRILIVKTDDVKIGLVVDGVTEVMEIPAAKIDTPLNTLDKIKVQYIYGEIKIDDRFLAIINLENIIKETILNKK